MALLSLSLVEDEGTLRIGDLPPPFPNIVSAVAQDTRMVQGSLRFNIDPFGRHAEQDIVKVYRSIGIEDVPDLDGPATSMTPSQKQAAFVVRSLLKKPRVLVLDEATNSMTTEQENQLHGKLLQSLDNSTTVLMVTHRLKNLLFYDRVLVVDNGVLVEDGKPRSLLNRPMGFLSALWKASGQDCAI